MIQVATAGTLQHDRRKKLSGKKCRLTMAGLWAVVAVEGRKEF